MFKALLKSRLQAFYSYFFRSSRLKKKHSPLFKIGITIFVIYAIAASEFSIGMLFDSMCEPMYKMQLEWLYFALAGLMALLLSFIFSIFMVQTQLYEAKDNDLLLAMPIPPKFILASRIMVLTLMNYVYQSLILLPAGVVYIINCPVSTLGIVFFALTFIFLPFLVMAISSFFGWVVAIISSKMRNKNTVTMVMSIGLLIGYFAVFSNIQKYINHLIENGDQIANVVQKALPPAYYFGMAITTHDILSLLIFLLFAIVPFVAVYALLSYSFIKIATTKRGRAKIEYKEESLKVSRPKTALIKKELLRFTSSPMYMLNGALGAVFTVVFAVVLTVKSSIVTDMFLQLPPEFQGQIGLLMAITLCALSATNIISAPSISLEGKNLWIARSLPVDSGDVLTAKAYMHMIVCLPTVIIAATSCSVFLSLSVAETLLVFLLPCAFTVFTAFVGVFINLRFPKFDWINETVAVKQSISTLVTMLVSIVSVIIPTVAYYLKLTDYFNAEVFLATMLVVFSGASFALYKNLTIKGKEIFETF
ncbi:MAG TPA: hypothetical protein VFD52_03210 [Clostridia bacterium]|nr:hypothetical protein [Clostridia bacterium]